MERIVCVRRCEDYDVAKLKKYISEIYSSACGPDPRGKSVLVKPNVLSDEDPRKCISTHPAFVEATILFLLEKGASEVLVGDSPAVHLPGFLPKKSGISDVCERTGARWVNFLQNSRNVKLRNGSIRVTAAALKADMIISLPKLKTHELMYLTASLKNTLGIVPGFNKTKQHALHPDRRKFGKFLVGSERSCNTFLLPDRWDNRHGRSGTR